MSVSTIDNPIDEIASLLVRGSPRPSFNRTYRRLAANMFGFSDSRLGLLGIDTTSDDKRVDVKDALDKQTAVARRWFQGLAVSPVNDNTAIFSVEVKPSELTGSANDDECVRLSWVTTVADEGVWVHRATRESEHFDTVSQVISKCMAERRQQNPKFELQYPSSMALFPQMFGFDRGPSFGFCSYICSVQEMRDGLAFVVGS